MFVRSRLLIPTLASLVLSFVAACSKDEPQPAPPASDVAPASGAPAPVDAKLNIQPTIGGKVFLVGKHQCELAVYAGGRVEGLVFDDKGDRVAADRVTEFSAALSAEADSRPRVKLLWDADAKRFRGQAEAQAGLTTRPIDVSLQIDGSTQTGVLEGYALLPAPAVEAKAVAQGDAALKAPQASAKASGSAKTLADARVKAPEISARNAAASLQAKAAAKAAVPKPELDVGAKASAGTEKKKSGASVKAKASFGFGN